MTNLWNHALPLIRYEVTDQIELLDEQEPCPCGCTHRRIADPYGRLDDGFRYGRSPCTRHVSARRWVATARSWSTRCARLPRVPRSRCGRRGPFDTAALAAEIAAELAALGVSTPRVDIDVVDALPRPPSGKLARFVALPARR